MNSSQSNCQLPMDGESSPDMLKDDLLDAMEQQRFEKPPPKPTGEDPKGSSTVADISISKDDDKSTAKPTPETECTHKSGEGSRKEDTPDTPPVKINQDTKKAVLAERSSLNRCVRRRAAGLSSSLTSSVTSNTTSASNAELPRRQSNVEVPTNQLLEEKINISVYGRAASLPPDFERGRAIHSDANEDFEVNEKQAKCGAVAEACADGKASLVEQIAGVVVPGAFAISSGDHDSFHNSFGSAKSGDTILVEDANESSVIYLHGDETTDVERNLSLGGLPMAMAVNTDMSDDPYLPAALELDPDAKKARTTLARRKMAYVAAGLLSLICVITVFVSTLWLSRDVSRDAVLRDALSRSVGELDFTSNHGYKEAIDWISFKDQKQLDTNDDTLPQRFLLAALYFSTQPPNSSWTHCAVDESATDNFCASPWNRQGLRWLSNDSECMWNGIYCRDGFVIGIMLNKFGLQGLFPNSITLLRNLTSIELARNNLSGTIPSAIFLSSIRWFQIDGNHLSGTLEGAAQWNELVLLDASNNRLSGTLFVPRSQSITVLSLNDNYLTGTIPSEIGDLSSLKAIRLHRNFLAGNIPSSFGRLRNLEQLDLQNNRLNGSIPQSLRECKQLSFLDVSENTLEGTLPLGLFQLHKLRELFLQGNSFSGTLPTPPSPPQNLISISFSGNRFFGTFPEVLCTSPNLKIAQSNCKHSTGDDAEFLCECCTSCCDRSGRGCVPAVFA